VPDTQSKAPPVWTTKSLLSDVTVITPLVCWPVFVIVKLCVLLDWPTTTGTEPHPRLDVETKRLADDTQEPAAQVPPAEHVEPLATQTLPTKLASQQPPPAQVPSAQQG